MFWADVIDHRESLRISGVRGCESRYRLISIPLQKFVPDPDFFKNTFGPSITNKIELRRTLFELYSASTPCKPSRIVSINKVRNEVGPFRYEHLQRSTRAIRLLSIDPPAHTPHVQQWGMSWDMPNCHMETFDLSPGHPPQPYVALSYAWGDLQAPKECIMLNGQTLEVTTTLYEFLCFFRSSNVHQTTRLWIWIVSACVIGYGEKRELIKVQDQICINQLDNGERSHTVSFIADIYREATFVVAWLGYDIWSTRDAQRLGPMSRDNVLLLHPILDNPYFTRLWIVQELLLSREVHFVCGHIWLPLLDIHKCREYRPGIDPAVTMPSVNLLLEKSRQCLHLEWNPNHPYHVGLVGAVMTYRGNACQDPRDKVYALMSFVKVEDRVPIDYSKTVEQVFRDAFQILERDWSQYPREFSMGSSVWHVLRLAKFMLPQSHYIAFVKMLKVRLHDRVQHDSYVAEVLWEFSRIDSVLAIEQG
ncbi:heterokaryon incompatibility protein-domain-containing protein [Paraphoma chrysanthemicola]|nr:heterokaryon incompatibility protein-domain-containing protein [Paraphoma chrysanthemicola]